MSMMMFMQNQKKYRIRFTSQTGQQWRLTVANTGPLRPQILDVLERVIGLREVVEDGIPTIDIGVVEMGDQTVYRSR